MPCTQRTSLDTLEQKWNKIKVENLNLRFPLEMNFSYVNQSTRNFIYIEFSVYILFLYASRSIRLSLYLPLCSFKLYSFCNFVLLSRNVFVKSQSSSLFFLLSIVMKTVLMLELISLFFLAWKYLIHLRCHTAHRTANGSKVKKWFFLSQQMKKKRNEKAKKTYGSHRICGKKFDGMQKNKSQQRRERKLYAYICVCLSVRVSVCVCRYMFIKISRTHTLCAPMSVYWAHSEQIWSAN